MKQFLTSVARSVPVLLERSTFQINLQGWPAATAIAAVGATIVATVMILSGSQVNPDEE